MFKVGDRVIRLDYDSNSVSGVVPGMFGTVTQLDGTEVWNVKWDNGASGGPYTDKYIALVKPTVAYKPGDKVKCVRQKLIDVPVGTVGEYLDMTALGDHRVIWPEVGLVLSSTPDWFELYTASTTPLSCARCHEPNDYAEPNLPNGTYACFSCRKYHGYALGGV